METQPPTPSKRPPVKALYWIVAAVMALVGALAIVQDSDYLKAGGQFALAAALVLLATAQPEETRAKKLVIYGLVVISIGLWVVRMLSRPAPIT